MGTHTHQPWEEQQLWDAPAQAWYGVMRSQNVCQTVTHSTVSCNCSAKVETTSLKAFHVPSGQWAAILVFWVLSEVVISSLLGLGSHLTASRDMERLTRPPENSFLTTVRVLVMTQPATAYPSSCPQSTVALSSKNLAKCSKKCPDPYHFPGSERQRWKWVKAGGGGVFPHMPCFPPTTGPLHGLLPPPGTHQPSCSPPHLILAPPLQLSTGHLPNSDANLLDTLTERSKSTSPHFVHFVTIYSFFEIIWLWSAPTPPGLYNFQ